jgi:hypothetical protein
MAIPRYAIHVVILFSLLAAAVAPNVLWLERSTVAIENRSNERIGDVELRVCASVLRVARLDPGGSQLLVLPKCGESTLVVVSGASGGGAESCKHYVESKMYHVDVWFDAARQAHCAYGYPPFAPLLLTKAVRALF